MTDVKPSKTTEVKELTVKQVKAVLDEKPQVPHIIELMFPDELPVSVVCASTGLTRDEIEDNFTVSEIKSLLEDVKTANPFFLTLLEKLSDLGKQVLINPAEPLTS